MSFLRKSASEVPLIPFASRAPHRTVVCADPSVIGVEQLIRGRWGGFGRTVCAYPRSAGATRRRCLVGRFYSLNNRINWNGAAPSAGRLVKFKLLRTPIRFPAGLLIVALLTFC